MSKYFLMILILYVFVSAAYSQSDSTFVLPELRIYQKENGKIIHYNFEEYKNNKFIVNDSMLTANPTIYDYEAKLSDIQKINLRNGTQFWGFAAGGAAFGFVLGFFAGGYFTIDGPAKFHIQGALLGSLVSAIPFGGIFGLVGLLAPNYDEYDIHNVPDNRRAEYLKKIFRKYKVLHK